MQFPTVIGLRCVATDILHTNEFHKDSNDTYH